MGRLNDKVVLVTGGASGVGRATCGLLAAEGARVVLTDINQEAGRQAQAEIGDTASYVQHDVSSEADWVEVMQLVAKRYGRLDALVNNAAIFPTENIEDATLEQFRFAHRINADSVFLGCKYAIQVMKQGRSGSLVNVASAASLQGVPFCAYSASKGSVTAMTRSIAAHCRNSGYRIRCNSVHPGGIVTPMTSAVRAEMKPEAQSFDDNPRTGFADPRDIGHLIVFLVSDESRYINGSELRIDNGLVSTLLL